MAMTEAAVAVVLAALANWAVIECWNHGEIFEKPRAWLEAHDPGFFVDLFACPYCLSHWTAAPLVAAALLLFADPQGWPWYRWVALPVLSFAVTRLSNFMNDVFHSSCRTPRARDTEEELGELRTIAEMEDAHGDPENPDPA